MTAPARLPGTEWPREGAGFDSVEGHPSCVVVRDGVALARWWSYSTEVWVCASRDDAAPIFAAWALAVTAERDAAIQRAEAVEVDLKAAIEENGRLRDANADSCDALDETMFRASTLAHLLAPIQAAARAYAAEGVSPGPGPLVEAVLRAGLQTVDTRAAVEMQRLHTLVAALRRLAAAQARCLRKVDWTSGAIEAAREAVARAGLAQLDDEVLDSWRARAEKAEGALAAVQEAARALADVVAGHVRHRYLGMCPDRAEPTARDPQCAACKALGALATLDDGAGGEERGT